MVKGLALAAGVFVANWLVVPLFQVANIQGRIRNRSHCRTFGTWVLRNRLKPPASAKQKPNFVSAEGGFSLLHHHEIFSQVRYHHFAIIVHIKSSDSLK